MLHTDTCIAWEPRLHLIRVTTSPAAKQTRNCFNETMWKHIDSSIHVITDFRYLGAHLTTRHATNSSTIDKRWEKAKQQLRKLRFCPAKAEAKAKAILSKIYAGAMYGVEAAGATPMKIA